MTKEEVRNYALKLAAAAADKKAEDIILMDISAIEHAVCDYFLICTCNSDAHLSAVVQEMRDRAAGIPGLGKIKAEGMEAKTWAILDFFDPVVHVMQPEARSYYRLERLWVKDKLELYSEDGNLETVDKSFLDNFYIDIDAEKYNAEEPGLPEDFWNFDNE